MLTASKRVSCVETPSGVEIRISAWKQPFFAWYLPFWLTAWMLGGLLIAYKLATAAQEHDWLLLSWFVPWAFGLVYALYAWLWDVWGDELIKVSARELTCQRVVFGHSRDWSFPLGAISNLRPSSRLHRWWYSNTLAPWHLSFGTIAFDVGGRTKRVGIGLKPDEVDRVIAVLQPRVSRPI